MRVVITNAVLLNGGDAAILLGIIRLLEDELGGDVEFVVMDSQPTAAGRCYPRLDVRGMLYTLDGGRGDGRASPGPVGRLADRTRRRRVRLAGALWRRRLGFAARLLLTKDEYDVVAVYAGASLVVSTGGTYLVEHYPFEHRLLECGIAVALGKPLVLFTQSMGPFTLGYTRAMVRRVVEQAELVMLRDQPSMDHVADLQPRRTAHCLVTSDAAFGLAPPATFRAAGRGWDGPSGPRRVAVSVRQWRHFKAVDAATGMRNYVDSIRRMVCLLVERYGSEVVFVSTCQGVGEYWIDDSRIADEIVRGLPGPVASRATVSGEFRDPEGLIELLKGFDMAVGTRMHFCILSLCAGVPVLPIAYEFKTEALFARIGLPEIVQDIETMSPEGLARGVEEFVGEIDRIARKMAAAVASERREAVASASRVREVVDRRAGRPGDVVDGDVWPAEPARRVPR